MASSLISNNGSEAQLQTNILTNTPGRVKVLVEDEEDVPVWHKILTRFCPDRSFELTPYSSEVSGKGKPKILSLADDFGPNLIGCVDSDYDWLLDQWTADGQLIAGNRYILQTHGYSIENLAAQPYGKSNGMLDCTLHSSPEQRNLDAICSSFILKVSEHIYEVLLWHLIMRKEQTDIDEIAKGWDEILNNVHYASILNDNHNPLPVKRIEMLEEIRKRGMALVERYEISYPHLISLRQALKDSLAQTHSLSPQNAYLFVRGHNLHDFLVHNLYRPICLEDVKSHRDDIRNNTTGQETANAKRHYDSLRLPFEKLCLRRTDYLADPGNPITKLMQDAVTAIFT